MSEAIQIETETPSGRYRAQVRGLTLRDIFAGLAMQGFLANPELFANDTYDETAARAYVQADAMLKVRARKEQP